MTTEPGAAVLWYGFDKAVKTSVLGENPYRSDWYTTYLNMQTDCRQVHTDQPSGWRAKRRWVMSFVYLLVSSLLLLVVLRLPRHRDWLSHTILKYYRQRETLGPYTDPETRQRVGYGAAYRYTELIKAHCQLADYFLIPPQRYLIRNAYQADVANGYVWLYPSRLYYHLGQSVHLLEMSSPTSYLRRATYTFWVQNQQLVVLPLTDRNRNRVLAEFKKYDPHFFAYTPQQARAYYMTAP